MVAVFSKAKLTLENLLESCTNLQLGVGMFKGQTRPARRRLFSRETLPRALPSPNNVIHNGPFEPYTSLPTALSLDDG